MSDHGTAAYGDEDIVTGPIMPSCWQY